MSTSIPGGRLPISMCQVNSEGKGRRKVTVHLKGGEQFVYQRSHLIFSATYFRELTAFPTHVHVYFGRDADSRDYGRPAKSLKVELGLFWIID